MKSLIIALIMTTLGLGITYAQDGAEPDNSDRHAELVKAKGAFKETWVHPDADFTQYDKVYLWEGQFEYRDVGPARKSRSTMMSSRKREFGISDADRQKFEAVVADAFVAEIQKGKRFTVVGEVGPDTIILRGAAVDIVSRVPPDMIGRSEIYLATIGEATFVMELIDAETGEVLAAVSERRHLGQGRLDDFSMPSNRVTVIADVKRWARAAAAKLRSELDKAIAGK